jgi:hypothetical protein
MALNAVAEGLSAGAPISGPHDHGALSDVCAWVSGGDRAPRVDRGGCPQSAPSAESLRARPTLL